MEKLEIRLAPELVERMDEVVDLLDLGSREELVQCTVRRYVDRYFIASKRTVRPG